MKFIQIAVEEAITNYDGKIPLAHYLKSFFKARPKLGSRDRRAISDGVYTYYRIARFVAPEALSIWSVLQWASLNQISNNPLIEKVLAQVAPKAIEPSFQIKFDALSLSNGLDDREWIESLLQQPNTFIRTINHVKNYTSAFEEKQIPYQVYGDNCIAVASGVNVANIIPEQFYVVQDYSSQRSLDALKKYAPFKFNQSISIWDTCAGAGGKMLLLNANYPKSTILSSDIRNSILHNLRGRAKIYGYKNVQTQQIDSSDINALASLKSNFDLVISDVPCTGSGTWARTPEQFYYFDFEKINEFALLQAKIAMNASTKVKPGGYFLYITCSVFKQENEAIVAQALEHNSKLKLIHQGLINGISDKADCMFVALMQCS